MKVICAGFSHTGTKSIAEALRILGYSKVHDFLEHSAIDGTYWTRIFDGRGSIDDFREMYKDVDAVADVPASIFWEEILEAFPDSKVILTMRDSEEVWFKSFAAYITHIRRTLFWERYMSIGFFLFRLFMPSYHSYFYNVCTAGYGYLLGNPNNELLLRNYYRRHNRNVLRGCPPRQLLIFNVKEGWEPLCKFLGKDVPENAPFPTKNKKDDSFVVNFFRGQCENDGGMREKMKKELYNRVTIAFSIFVIPIFVIISMTLGLL